MVIVAGNVTVEPRQREAYLAGCVSIVKRSRSLAGCLDFAITADPIDPGRVNIFERWESQAALETFRGEDEMVSPAVPVGVHGAFSCPAPTTDRKEQGMEQRRTNEARDLLSPEQLADSLGCGRERSSKARVSRAS